MHNLVEVALGDLFPKENERWHSKKQYIHEIFLQERKEKERAVVRDLADAGESLKHALRKEVVSRVISIFPYVHFQ